MTTGFDIPNAAVALTASATKSLVLIDAGVNEYELTEIGFGCESEADVAAVRFELYRVTSLGSPAGTSTTPRKRKEASGAADATSLTNLTTEPTTVEVLRHWYVRPDGGMLVLQDPLGDESTQRTATDGRLGIRAITPANCTPNAIAYASIRE